MKYLSDSDNKVFLQKKDLDLISFFNEDFIFEVPRGTEYDDFIVIDNDSVWNIVNDFKYILDINFLEKQSVKELLAGFIVLLQISNKKGNNNQHDFDVIKKYRNYMVDYASMIMHKTLIRPMYLPFDVASYEGKLIVINDLFVNMVKAVNPDCFYLSKCDESSFIEDEVNIIVRYVLKTRLEELRLNDSINYIDTQNIEINAKESLDRKYLRINIFYNKKNDKPDERRRI